MPFSSVATGIYRHLSVYFTKVKAQLSFIITDPSRFKHQRHLTYCSITGYIQTDRSCETAAGQQYFSGFQYSVLFIYLFYIILVNTKKVKSSDKGQPKATSSPGGSHGLQRGQKVEYLGQKSRPWWKVAMYLRLPCLTSSRFHFACFLYSTQF